MNPAGRFLCLLEFLSNTYILSGFNKLSRRRGKHPQVGSGDARCHRKDKENIGGASSGQCSKEWPAAEFRVSNLHTVPEDEDPPESSTIQRQNQPVSYITRKFPMTGNLGANTSSPFAVNAQDTQHKAKRSNGQRDSIYTDVDDGSFIEFCHGKEKGERVPHQPDDSTKKMPLLYYTCESDNDTQYSTSTKTKNALVGFHKYLDKLRSERDLRNIHEENRTEKTGPKKQLDLHDETVITCSADIRRFFCSAPAADAINSTVIDKIDKVTLPSAFSEISTLTVNAEVVSGSESQSQSKQPKVVHNVKQQTVIMSESSGEGGESHPTERVKGVKVIPIGSHIKKPPQSVGIVQGIPMLVNGGQTRTPYPPPSPKVIVAMHEGCPSLVSEDVSIVSNSVAMPRKFPSVVSEDVSVINDTCESPVHIPQKCSASEILRTVGMATSPKRGAKPPVVYEDENKDEEHRGGVGHVMPEWRFGPSKDENLQTPGQTKFSVHKWIITSPFKESSFDSSFLQRKEDSFISESPSQPKLCHENESKKINSEPLEFSDLNKEGKSSQFINKCGHSPAKGVSVGSYSEISECESSIKRTKAKERVSASSDELEDNKRNGMFVTQRRKKKHSKKVTASLKKNYIEASDEEEGESLCLRLARGPNEVSGTSGMTIQTIGRVATSPDNQVNSPHETPTQTFQKFRKTPPRHRRKSDPDGFMGMENLPNNSPCLEKLVPDTKLHHGDSIESLTLPPPKAGSLQHLRDSDGPLDLSLIRKELDSLYSSEWRKNEEAIFKTSSREIKERSRITSSEKSIEGQRRRSRSCPRLSSEMDKSERENSIIYQVSETSDDEESLKSNRNKGNENMCVPYKDEKTVKTSVCSHSSPEDDSFEEYLKKVRSTQKKLPQKIDFSSEDEDKYESSFINDESDESYSLPQMPPNPYKSPPETLGTPWSKVSIPSIQKRDRRREKHHSNDDIRPVSPNVSEKSSQTKSKPFDSSEEDSFEEYLKKVRSTEKKKQQHRIVCSSEDEDSYESSFVTDDSDNENYSLPKVIQKSQKNSPEDKNSIFKSKGKGTTRPITEKKVIKTWRDSPTINLTSDSDSSESKLCTENSKKVTPQKKYRNKVLPKTEGHCRRAKKYGTSQVSPRLPFLASLSSNVSITQCHAEALPYVKTFQKKKEELVKVLYKFYNTHVFDSKLPSSMNITWNARLTKTAGYCYYQINGASETRRGSRIELSTKVIDCPERLRDTLIHELCHAAAWIISGYKDGHGPLWKAWAAKARAAFPELPPINRCHSYDIQCKYTYRCTRCSYRLVTFSFHFLFRCT